MRPLLIIGGTDSSGGAGLTRDAAMARPFDTDVKPVVTAVTVQTGAEVRQIAAQPAALVAAQIAAAFDRDPPAAVKIGMLARSDIVTAVAAALRSRRMPIVLDPVLRASSGGALFTGGDLDELLPLARLITPNLEEAAFLTGRPQARSLDEICGQARLLLDRGARAVLIKGGHGAGPECTDHLFDDDAHLVFAAPRLRRKRRGTGCALATAIACELAAGERLSAACERAKTRIWHWIAATGSAA